MAQPGAEPGTDPGYGPGMEPGTEPGGGGPGAGPGMDADYGPGGGGPGGGGPGSNDNDIEMSNNNYTNNNDNTIICICGKPFEQLLSQNCYGGTGVQCDKCSKSISKDSIVYHCPDEKIKIHQGGYDLCSTCATKEINTMTQQLATEGGDGKEMEIDTDGKPKLYVPNDYISDNNNPPCICGKELELTQANAAYASGGGIKCDLCSRSCGGTDPVYHCNDGKSAKHDGGYDLCFDCGWKYVEYKMDEQAMALTMGNDDNLAMLAPGTTAHSEQVQTEALIPICICGDELLKTDSRVYGEDSVVVCDNCAEYCRNDDVVYHCIKGRKAAEHQNGFDLCEKCAMKQNKKVRTNWLSDLFEDMVVTIARFVVNKRPSSIMNLKCVNKYWYQCLNPNKPNVNALWQHNICRPMFIHIPKDLKIKRWDRYYQYRYHSILRYRKDHGDNTKINKKLVYTKYKMIENCTYDTKEINAFYRDPYSFEIDDDDSVKIKKKKGKKGKNEDKGDEKDQYDGYFEAQIGSHGLPRGYKWKLKCPVLALKLKKRGDDKYYCGVCKRNVYIVENEQEMKERVEKGQCVQYTLSGKPSKPKPQNNNNNNHPYPTPRPVRRGKIAVRR